MTVACEASWNWNQKLAATPAGEAEQEIESNFPAKLSDKKLRYRSPEPVFGCGDWSNFPNLSLVRPSGGGEYSCTAPIFCDLWFIVRRARRTRATAAGPAPKYRETTLAEPNPLAVPLTSDPTRRLAHSRMCYVPLANVCHQSAPLLLPLEYIVPNHLSDLSADSHGHAFTHRLPPTPSWIEHSEEQCRGASYQVRTIDLRFRQFEKSFGRGPWHVVMSRNPARESNPPSQSRDSDTHRACWYGDGIAF